MKSSDPAFVRHAPKLTDDDVFYSNTVNGKLAYTMPKLSDLTGAPESTFNGVDYILAETSVLTMSPGTDVWIWDLVCQTDTPTFCRLAYSRWATPVVYYLSSSVVYYGQLIQVNVNHFSSNDNLKRAGKDYPFESLTIDKTTLDFDNRYNVDEDLARWSVN